MALTPLGELPSNARVTVDSAPIIYFLEDHSKLAARFAPVFDAAAQGALSIFVSTITVAEVVAGPLKAGNEILAAQYCEALRGSKDWEIIPVAEEIAIRGAPDSRARLFARRIARWCLRSGRALSYGGVGGENRGESVNSAATNQDVVYLRGRSGSLAELFAVSAKNGYIECQMAIRGYSSW